MHLKEIYMKNFKSFGHEKRVPFRPGVTAITGPNGSGKSNIGDAILFVLGPKSSKAIRADRLSHLIFNGGKSGKPANHCKVSLIFDNADRLLPVDTTQVELTRVIKLSSKDPNNYYSHFYINGKTSQLNEFEKLLSHARISANGYNLVQQGDINRITSMGNIDRRRILDSIAGISIFDKDIDKANRDKEETLLNLQSVDILLTEIENLLERLKRERDNAIKYQEIKNDHEYNQARLLKRRILNLDSTIRDSEHKIEKYDQEIQTQKGNLKENREEKTAYEGKLKEIERRLLGRGGAEAEELREQIDELTVQIARTEEVMKYQREDRQKLAEVNRNHTREIQKVQKEIKRVTAEKQNASKELKERTSSLERLIKEIDVVRKKITNTNTQTMDIQREILLLKRKYDEQTKMFHDKKLELDRINEKHRIRTGELDDLTESIEGLEFEIKDLNWRIDDLSIQSKNAGKKHADLGKKLHDLLQEEKDRVKELQELEHLIRKKNIEFSRKKAESQAAEHMTTGIKEPVNLILRARSSGELKGVVGTVADLLEVDEEYRTAISVAAGAKLQAVIVENDTVAAKGIQLLKREKAGRVTFLPLNKMIAHRTRGKALMLLRNEGILGLAIELIDFDERYRSAFSYVFKDTVIAQDLDIARKNMGGVRIVTKDGEIIDPSGAITGGTLKPFQMKFTTSKDDIDRLSSELRVMNDRHEVLSAKLGLMREEISMIQKEIHGSKVDLTMDINKMETERNRVHSRLRAQNTLLEQTTKELQEMQSLKQQTITDVENTQKMLKDLEEKVTGLNEILLRATDKNLADSINSLEQEKSDLDSVVKEIQASIAIFDQQISLLTQKAQSLEHEITENDKKISKGKETEKECKVTITDLKEKKEASIKVQLSMSKELEGIRKERDSIIHEINEKEKEIERDINRISTFSQMVDELQLNLPQLQEELADLKEEFATLGREILETDLPGEEELRKMVKVLSDRMRQLEPVNMLAVTEYDSLSEKRKEKIENRKRLEDQKNELEKVVQELTLKKKRALDGIFGEVNKNFQEIYHELSNGGSAELILENPENPFEGGLEISARPKGKKVYYLNALSGGEKSLTAIAFIFAIQRYMPSPFYYLDEVDMYLDATNAGNVATMLKENSKFAQIIIVSLRKVTLMKTDNLYGVTMHGKGLSDIVTFMSKESLKYIAGDDLKDDDFGDDDIHNDRDVDNDDVNDNDDNRDDENENDGDDDEDDDNNDNDGDAHIRDKQDISVDPSEGGGSVKPEDHQEEVDPSKPDAGSEQPSPALAEPEGASANLHEGKGVIG